MDFARGDSFSAGSDMPEGSWRGRHRKPQMVTRHCHWDQFISLLGQRKWNLSCNILNFMFFSGWILVSNENDLTLRNSGGGKREGCDHVCDTRVAELGSLSSRAKMAMKIFVKRIFTIFASNASFLRAIANLQN